MHRFNLFLTAHCFVEFGHCVGKCDNDTPIDADLSMLMLLLLLIMMPILINADISARAPFKPCLEQMTKCVAVRLHLGTRTAAGT
jgi:hypothetical protein